MRIAYLLIIAATVLGCHSAKTPGGSRDNTLSAAEKSEGWQLLFDGTTTNGWHTYGSNSVNKAWAVTDAAIHTDTSARRQLPANESKDILTDDEFDNFHLKVDWKISLKGNSGIIFYVHEDKAKYSQTYYTGPEMQALDNNGHADAKIPKHRAGDLYDLISSSSEPVKPAGEWNHAETVANKGKLDFYLNGQHIINTTMWNDSWKQMVAGSKFKSMPDFSKFTKGRIALQEHGDMVWYKNIKIKKL